MIIKRRIILIGVMFILLISSVLGMFIIETGDQSNGIQADCQSGYVVTGGGFLDNGGSENDQDQSRPLNDKSGWYCQDDKNYDANSECHAVCIEEEKIDVEIVKQIGSFGRGSQAICPTDYTILGGGFIDNSGGDDQDENYPLEDQTGWWCKEDESRSSAECYAVCGKAKTDYELNCIIESLTGLQDEGVQVDCPSGYVVTGGGWLDAGRTGADQNYSKPSGNGWICGKRSGSSGADSQCYAVCCDINSLIVPEPEPDPEPTVHTCSDSKQKIMVLSELTNAHGELWDQGNYGVEICYDEIFGSAYTNADGSALDDTVHDCATDGSNKIIGLNADTNAHAEKPSLDNYGSDICYGNLECSAKSSCDTANGERSVIALSDSTNAHIAKAYYIIEESQEYDIEVTDIALSPEPMNNNQEITEFEVYFKMKGPSEPLDYSETIGVLIKLNGKILSNKLFSFGFLLSQGLHPISNTFHIDYSQSPKINERFFNLSKDGENTIEVLLDYNGLWQESDENNNHLSKTYTVQSGLTETSGCSDTDNGMDIYNQGTVTLGSESFTDSCETGVGGTTGLKEYYCSTDGQIKEVFFNYAQHNCNEGEYGEQFFLYENNIICCKRADTGPIEAGDTYWASMNNEEVVITEADVGDEVKMIWKNIGLADGTTIYYGVEEGGIINCVGDWPSEDRYASAIVENNRAVATWQVRECTGGGNHGMRFVVRDIDNTQTDISDWMMVDTDPSNENPVAVIDYPNPSGSEIERSFISGSLIQFNQTSYDIDSDFDVEWDFGDGTTYSGRNCQTGEETGASCNTTHSYATGGAYHVTLTATDTHGATSEDDLDLLVYNREGTTVLAIIDSPSDNAVIDEITEIEFKGESSKVAKCSATVPTGRTYYTPIVGPGEATQYCYDLNKPPSSENPAYEMLFNWTIDRDNKRILEYYKDNWNEGKSFTSTLPEGEYDINLKIGYDDFT